MMTIQRASIFFTGMYSRLASRLALVDWKKFLQGLLLYSFIACVAFVYGMLAVTANPLFIALGLGVVGGGMLLAVPRLMILFLLVVGLLMGALISIAGPQFNKLTWGMSMFGLLLLIPSFLALINTKAKQIPFFIWFAIIFLVYAVLVSFVRWDSLSVFIAGFKRYFQVFGLMFALVLLNIKKEDFARWQKLLLGVGLLQFPFALYELVVLVPKRGGLTLSSYTTDVVAGTFGANLDGGSPGSVMVIFLLIMFGFIFARWRSNLIKPFHFFILSFILLLPLGMGETKIALVMVPLAWLVLIRHDVISAPLKYLPVLFFGMAMTMVLGYVYIALIMNSTVADVFDSTVSYNFASAGYGELYLNRTTVLSFWLSQQGLHDPIGFFFGNGLGTSYIGQVSGKVAMRYPNYGINLTAASGVLWDLGIFGFGLFIGIFVTAWRTAEKLYRESNDALVKADVLGIQAAISLFLLFIIYTQDIVTLIGMEIIYTATLGYLGFLYVNHCQQRALK